MPSGSAGAGCRPASTSSRTRRQTSTITSPTSTDAVAQALGRQVPHRLLGRREQQVGGVVGEHPVVLLGHPPVERAQAGLQVRHRDVHLDRGDRAGQRRVGVAVDQHPVRLLAARAPGPWRASTAPVCTPWLPEPTPRCTSGSGMPRPVKNTSDRFDVVVLAGVHDHVLVLGRRESWAIGASLTSWGRAPTTLSTFISRRLLRLAKGDSDRSPYTGDRSAERERQPRKTHAKM